MPDLAVAAAVCAVIFLAELPDKSLFASLVLGARYPPLQVWTGVAAAFAVHVVIAVTAGQLLTLLPHRLVQAVVAALFLAGAGYLILASFRPAYPVGDPAESSDAARLGARVTSPARVAVASFAVVFLAEWGDITQITIANLAARYSDPVSVAIGAAVGLWAISALAISAGAKILARVPAAWVRRVTAAILLGFGIFSAVGAVAG